MPLKAALGTDTKTPMVAADFDGDGWPDLAEISVQKPDSSDMRQLVVAHRGAPVPEHQELPPDRPRPRTSSRAGSARSARGRPANGACSGGSVTVNGTPCDRTRTCRARSAGFAELPLLLPDVRDVRPADRRPPCQRCGDSTPRRLRPPTRPATSARSVTPRPEHRGARLGRRRRHRHPVRPQRRHVSRLASATHSATRSTPASTSGRTTARTARSGTPRRSRAPATSRRSRTRDTGTGVHRHACNNARHADPEHGAQQHARSPRTRNLGFDVVRPTSEVPTFAYADIDKDGKLDLVLGSPGCCSSSRTRPTGCASSRARTGTRRGDATVRSAHARHRESDRPQHAATATHPGFEGALTGVFVVRLLRRRLSGPHHRQPTRFAYNTGERRPHALLEEHRQRVRRPFGDELAVVQLDAVRRVPAARSTCNPGPDDEDLRELRLDDTCTRSSPPPQFPDFDMGAACSTTTTIPRTRRTSSSRTATTRPSSTSSRTARRRRASPRAARWHLARSPPPSSEATRQRRVHHADRDRAGGHVDHLLAQQREPGQLAARVYADERWRTRQRSSAASAA